MIQHAASMVRRVRVTASSPGGRRIAGPAGMAPRLAARLALASAVGLAACSMVPKLPPAPAEPPPESFTANLPAYRIQVGDVLEVRLLLNPELNEEVTVRPDGHISTTAVPDMDALGCTPADLANS